MKSTAAWEADVNSDLTPLIEEHATNGGDDTSPSPNKIETLKELTFRILREVQSMRDVNAPSIDSGIDFYEEVTRFEVDLIKRALMHTGGHQGRAARLLNLKITTLNSKIKHYGIEIAAFLPGISLAGSVARESQQRADSAALPIAVS
ncbi:MAG TPA: helix-turn-helix domain-containing protein [Pyrinomonadaceae bacterium]